MAQTTTSVGNKNTGDSLTAAEFNNVTAAVNANSADAQSRLTSLEADAAAGVGGLVAGDIYATAAGDLKVKL